MKRWFRVTLPNGSYVGAFLLVYLISESIFQFLIGPGFEHVTSEGLIEIAAIVYGLHRGLGFHPVFNPEYCKWLAMSPWTNRKPLPAGPAHLVPQDLVVLAILGGLAYQHYPRLHPAHVAASSLIAYELMLAASFTRLAMPWFAYAVPFGLGLVALTWDLPAVSLAVAGALYVIALAGLVRSLDKFANWNLAAFEETQFTPLSPQQAVDRMRLSVLGWPFDCIRPRDVARSISYRDGTMVSLLIGWWLFVSIQRFPLLQRPETWHFGFACAMFPALARLQTYCLGYASPISLWGRIVTLRWIIPGHDQVYLAPLAILALAGGGEVLVLEFPALLPLSVPATVTAIFLCALNLGPSLARWRLTGSHRLVPATLMAKQQAEVQQV